MSAHASPPATSSLRGHWLLLGRMVWVAVAITVLAIILFSIPSSFEHYQSVCSAASEVCSERGVGQPTPEGVRALREMGLSVRSDALFYVVVEKIFQLVWFAVGAIIFFRRSEDRMALLVSLFLVTFGPVLVIPTAAYTLISSQPAWWLPVRGVEIVGSVCSALFFFLFPGGRFAPRWTRWLAVAFIAFQVSTSLYAGFYSRSPALEAVSYLVFLSIIVSLVSFQVYRYRRISSEAQRRQTRWVVFGTTLGVSGTSFFKLPVDLLLVGGNTPLALLLLKAGFAFSFLLVPLSISV